MLSFLEVSLEQAECRVATMGRKRTKFR